MKVRTLASPFTMRGANCRHVSRPWSISPYFLHCIDGCAPGGSATGEQTANSSEINVVFAYHLAHFLQISIWEFRHASFSSFRLVLFPCT
jgi:hypothetical protein